MTSVFGGHAAHGFAGAKEIAEDVGCEDALQAGGVDLVETGLAFDYSGIVD